MAEGRDEELRLEVVGLAEQLAMEVLNTRPRDVHDIYTTCAEYLAAKMQERNVSQRMAAAATAWTDEKRFMKQRQVAFQTYSHVSESDQSRDPNHVRPESAPTVDQPRDPSRVRPESAPAPKQHELPKASTKVGDCKSEGLIRRHSEGVKVQNEDVRSSHGSLRKSLGSQETLDPIPSDDEAEAAVDNDSGFSNSDGVCEGASKAEETLEESAIPSPEENRILSPGEGSIPSPSSSLFSTSIGENTVSSEGTRPTTRIEVREADEDKSTKDKKQVMYLEEDDLCTFAYFKSTTERGQETSEEGDETFERRSSSTGSQRLDLREHSAHILSFIGHESAVTQCRVAQRFLATSSKDGTLRIWDICTGTPLRTLNCRRPIHDFCLVYFRMKLPYLVVCCEDGGIVLIKVREDRETGKVNLSLGGEYTGHLPNPIRCMAISRSRLDLVTGCCFMMNQITKRGRASLSCRGTLKTWDLDSMLRSAEEDKPYDGTPIAVRTMRQIISRGPSWQMASNAYDGEEPVMYGIRSLAYLPDGTCVVVGFGKPDDEGKGDIHMFGLLCAKTLATLWMQPAYICQVTRLDMLPILSKRTYPGDKFRMLLSTFDSVGLLTVQQEQEKNKILVETTWTKKFDQPHFGSVSSPNAKMVASCLGMDVVICACATGNELMHIENAHGNWVRSVCFSLDSTRIASVAADGSAKLWRVPGVNHLLPVEVEQKPRKRPCSASGSSPSTSGSSSGVYSS